MEQTTDRPQQRVHHGRNVKRIREFQGIKQEALAELLGQDWTQKKVSGIENKETIEPEVIAQVAKALNVSEKTIENLTDEMAATFFNTYNFHDNSSNQGAIGNNNSPNTFNPLDKLMEVIGKNETLHEQVKALYEQLLKVEREKNQLLERMLNER